MKLYELVLGIGALCITFGFVSCTGCGEGYSEGERVGVVTKLSKKGLIFKSWEGQMNLGGSVPGTDGGFVANVWYFHTTDSMAKEIQTYMEHGIPVRIAYEQWLWSPITQDANSDALSIRPVEKK